MAHRTILPTIHGLSLISIYADEFPHDFCWMLVINLFIQDFLNRTPSNRRLILRYLQRRWMEFVLVVHCDFHDCVLSPEWAKDTEKGLWTLESTSLYKMSAEGQGYSATDCRPSLSEAIQSVWISFALLQLRHRYYVCLLKKAGEDFDTLSVNCLLRLLHQMNSTPSIFTIFGWLYEIIMKPIPQIL